MRRAAAEALISINWRFFHQLLVWRLFVCKWAWAWTNYWFFLSLSVSYLRFSLRPETHNKIQPELSHWSEQLIVYQQICVFRLNRRWDGVEGARKWSMLYLNNSGLQKTESDCFYLQTILLLTNSPVCSLIAFLAVVIRPTRQWMGYEGYVITQSISHASFRRELLMFYVIKLQFISANNTDSPRSLSPKLG